MAKRLAVLTNRLGARRDKGHGAGIGSERTSVCPISVNNYGEARVRHQRGILGHRYVPVHSQVRGVGIAADGSGVGPVPYKQVTLNSKGSGGQILRRGASRHQIQIPIG